MKIVRQDYSTKIFFEDSVVEIIKFISGDRYAVIYYPSKYHYHFSISLGDEGSTLKLAFERCREKIKKQKTPIVFKESIGRVHWKVTLTHTGEFDKETMENHDLYYSIWNYKIENEENSVNFTGEIESQSDSPPSMVDVMCDFQGHMNKIAGYFIQVVEMREKWKIKLT
jgi:hypothetical protein